MGVDGLVGRYKKRWLQGLQPQSYMKLKKSNEEVLGNMCKLAQGPCELRLRFFFLSKWY